jgi:hypothetical protein
MIKQINNSFSTWIFLVQKDPWISAFIPTSLQRDQVILARVARAGK